MTRDPLPHLVIIGGGFAGLWATRALGSRRMVNSMRSPSIVRQLSTSVQ